MNHFTAGWESPSVEIYLSYYGFNYFGVSNLSSSPQQPTMHLSADIVQVGFCILVDGS
jgi:hypothetical protein